MAAKAYTPNGLPDVLQSLSEDEWMLVRLRDQLYGGRWVEMSTDLHHRRRGEPYIFKLVNRIDEDLDRIRRLEALEGAWGVNLGDHLPSVVE